MAGKIINIQRGFSLVELLVTLIILGAGIAALTYLQSRLTTVGSESTAQYNAITLANNKIASWQTSSYDSILPVTADTDSSTVGNTVFTRTWNVTAYTSPTYKVMDVSVSWTDIDGDVHSIKLASAIAKTSAADASL